MIHFKVENGQRVTIYMEGHQFEIELQQNVTTVSIDRGGDEVAIERTLSVQPEDVKLAGDKNYQVPLQKRDRFRR